MTVPALLLACVLGMAICGMLIAAILRHTDPTRSTARALVREAEEKIVFLFDGHNLVDATRAARDLIKGRSTETTDWDRFIALFAPHFPHFRSQLEQHENQLQRTIISPDNPDICVVTEQWNGLTRISYQNKADQGEELDLAAQQSLSDEVQALRKIAEDSPQLIWKQDTDGTITWANRAYLDLAAQQSDCGLHDIPMWPPIHVFETASTDVGTELNQRVNLRIAGTPKDTWFEITAIPRVNETLFFASEITQIVEAEETQRSYVQTLVKTFAQLSIGLAIFDRDRRLIIFNPAMMDLTGIRPEFLASRPGIHTFLDRLREARMIPEPKNYADWRQTIVNMENSAQNGSYCEKWDLPNGQTFRVTGRPHPDGALAFLFEDISAEISLTRRFRNQIESSQAVLDHLDTAVAVFSSAGTLTIHNAAYEKMWHAEPIAPFLGTTLLEESRIWQKATVPTPVWSKLREEISTTSNRAAWSDNVRLNNGLELGCTVRPLPSGDMLVEFSAPTHAAGASTTVPDRWAAHG